MPSVLEENFWRLKEKVLEKRPVLREILQKRGSKNLYTYAKDYIDVNLNPAIKKRQDEFLGTFHKEVALRLGDEVAESAVLQLEKHYFVSTADHHGPLCHAFFITSNLLTAAPYIESDDPFLKNVIVLACANVSLNNSSFPRGLLFHSHLEGKIQLNRLPFSPAADRLCPVFNYRAYTIHDIRRAKNSLNNMVKNGEVASRENEIIQTLLDEIYLKPSHIESANFSDQITKTNFDLWKRFFHSSKIIPPNLVYLEQESLVGRLLIDHHLYNDTSIYHILFDPAYHQHIALYFEGIQGAFSQEQQWGTYFFWALPKGQKYRLQLWKEGSFLVSSDKSYRLELTPDNVKRALENKEIIPSMKLCYMTLAFYYGLKCLGGFSQVNYLTFMKNAYIKMHADQGNYRSIEVCARAQTKEMGGDYTLAFLKGFNDEVIPASGLDLILYGHENTWKIFVEESKEITLDEAVSALLPEFYRILYPEAEREGSLADISSDAIIKLIQLDKKIKPCVSL